MCCGAPAEVEVRCPASCCIRPGNDVVAVDGCIEIARSLHACCRMRCDYRTFLRCAKKRPEVRKVGIAAVGDRCEPRLAAAQPQMSQPTAG
jgi:hypothetical protein